MYHIHWKNRENLRCEQCYLSHFLFYDLQYFLNSVTLYTRHIKNGKTRLSLSQQSRCQPAALPRQVLWRWGWAGGCCRLLAGAFTFNHHSPQLLFLTFLPHQIPKQLHHLYVAEHQGPQEVQVCLSRTCHILHILEPEYWPQSPNTPIAQFSIWTSGFMTWSRICGRAS